MTGGHLCGNVYVTLYDSCYSFLTLVGIHYFSPPQIVLDFSHSQLALQLV